MTKVLENSLGALPLAAHAHAHSRDRHRGHTDAAGGDISLAVGVAPPGPLGAALGLLEAAAVDARRSGQQQRGRTRRHAVRLRGRGDLWCVGPGV